MSMAKLSHIDCKHCMTTVDKEKV